MSEYAASDRRVPLPLTRVGGRDRDQMGASRRCTADKVRRGRPGREEYVRLVTSLVRKDVWALEKCTAFASYPGVRALVALHQHDCLPMGTALMLLMQRAVHDVMEMTMVLPVSNLSRIATFLQLWYCEGQTVVGVARALGLEHTHVVKSVQRPALDLVAHRFLTLAEQVDPLT